MEFMVPHALQTANAPLTHRRDMLLAGCWRAQRMNPQYISHAQFSTHRPHNGRSLREGDFQVSRLKSRGDAEIIFEEKESLVGRGFEATGRGSATGRAALRDTCAV